MALTTYTVKRGDYLGKICSGGCGKEYAASIAGNTVQAKINTLVRINKIPNPDLIYVGQVLKLCETASSSSSTSTKPNVPEITAFGLQAQDDSGRAMYVAWSFSRANVENYQVQWSYYADGQWFVTDHNTTSAEAIYCNDTYSAPENALKVKVRVLAISKTYTDKNGNEHKYFTDKPWSAEKIHDFANNPPFPPGSPSIKIEDLKLTASIENIDAKKLNAESVEFEIVKNNSASLGASPAVAINTATNYVAYQCDVEAGAEYKVRARTKNKTGVSTWSDFSSNEGTKPSAPSEITQCKAKTYSDGKVSAYLEWAKVSNAETYEIEYTTNREYFDGSDGTTTISGIEFNHHEITNLELGKEYFFRVRANNNDGDSEWSEIKSTPLGTTPIAPTTWSSTTTAVVGEPLNLYWVHNSEDNSTETYAEVRLYVNDVLQSPDITVKKPTDEENKDKNSFYALDTKDYPEGTKIRWQVRTAGVTKVYGEWSIERVIDIYAKPTLALSVTKNADGTGEIIDTLTSFPFYIYALAGPKTQAPIGYQVKITANEFYETVDETGIAKMVNKGDDIYSKHFDITNALLIEMSADNIDLQADIEYTITVLVTMNSGLTAEASHNFKASWEDIPYNINANVTIDEDTYTALITPFCENEEGGLVEDITLSVYRREFDGTFKEIATGIPNTNSVAVSDPHPALDYARYRIVGKTISTGAISYYDLPGVEVNGDSVLIQWSEEWSVFDSTGEYSTEKPAWSGSMLKIPYNIDITDTYDTDSLLVSYIGRKYPVAYHGTQLGTSSTWRVEIPASDKETLYAIRRLSVWSGVVYVREPSGSGYWATVAVSYTKNHKEVTIPVTFTITRVEGGI